MVRPKDLNPDDSPRAFYGARLRSAREQAGLSQDRLGAKVFCSGAYIAQIETMVRSPQAPLGRLIDRELGTDIFEGLARAIANDSPLEDYFQAAAELEARAREICAYAPLFVPGPLQTAGYARSVFEAARPACTAAQIEDRVAARMCRAALLDHETTPQYWGVLDEAVLRRPVGGSAVMAEQLGHIADLADRRRIDVQVLPFARGACLLAGETFLMRFDEEPDAAYAEGNLTGELLEAPSRIERVRQQLEWLRSTATSPEESLVVIRSAAQDYAHDYTD
jgi:transcriptional regulator with XRE-family HTH domain